MIQFLTVDDFDDIVSGSDKPVLVDFYAEWCGPCKAAAPILDDLSDDYADDLAIAKVDVDAQPELAKRFDVLSIPTVILFNEGEEVDRKIGFGGRAGYEELINKVLKKTINASTHQRINALTHSPTTSARPAPPYSHILPR